MEKLGVLATICHPKFGTCYTFVGDNGIELLIPKKGLMDVYSMATMNNGHAHGDVTVIARPSEVYQRETV